jgi:hypothetical protein
MPKLYLVGGKNHREGFHTIHSPKLDGEGKPATGEHKGTVSTVFENGVAYTDDAGTAKWLQEKGHAAAIEVPAYGLCQPGKGPVLEFDDAGVATVVKDAEPAALPGVKADDKKVA